MATRFGCAYRHLQANLYLICTTSWPEDGYKHSRNMSPCIN